MLNFGGNQPLKKGQKLIPFEKRKRRKVSSKYPTFSTSGLYKTVFFFLQGCFLYLRQILIVVLPRLGLKTHNEMYNLNICHSQKNPDILSLGVLLVDLSGGFNFVRLIFTRKLGKQWVVQPANTYIGMFYCNLLFVFCPFRMGKFSHYQGSGAPLFHGGFKGNPRCPFIPNQTRQG